MVRLTRNDLLTAFSHKQDVAERLGKAIDSLGLGPDKGNGVLSDSEVQRALAIAKAPAPEAQGTEIRSALAELFSEGFVDIVSGPSKFAERVHTEQGAAVIQQDNLFSSLQVLCKDPNVSVRDPTTPIYTDAVQWVTGQLAAAGVQAYGDVGADGKRSFEQRFSWENRFAPGKVETSQNIVGLIPGKGPEPRKKIVLVGHLDNLSQHEKLDYKRRDGRDLTHYEGANDNASAVAGLLDIAKGLQQAGDNQLDVIVFIPSAEEDGLKGTEAGVQGLPVDDIVGAINLEMIGGNQFDQILLYGGANDFEARNNPLYARTMKVAQESGVKLDPGPHFDDNEHWWDRSDHKIFANLGIPSVMFHGRAVGNYHTNKDDLEHLNLGKIETVSKTVLRTVRDLANDSDPAEKKGHARFKLTDFPGAAWLGGPEDRPARR